MVARRMTRTAQDMLETRLRGATARTSPLLVGQLQMAPPPRQRHRLPRPLHLSLCRIPTMVKWEEGGHLSPHRLARGSSARLLVKAVWARSRSQGIRNLEKQWQSRSYHDKVSMSTEIPKMRKPIDQKKFEPRGRLPWPRSSIILISAACEMCREQITTGTCSSSMSMAVRCSTTSSLTVA